MKTLSILELLNREYLSKEILLYMYKRKTFDNNEALEFTQIEQPDYYNPLEIRVVVDDIYYMEYYNYEVGEFESVFKFEFCYEGNKYSREFLNQPYE